MLNDTRGSRVKQSARFIAGARPQRDTVSGELFCTIQRVGSVCDVGELHVVGWNKESGLVSSLTNLAGVIGSHDRGTMRLAGRQALATQFGREDAVDRHFHEIRVAGSDADWKASVEE